MQSAARDDLSTVNCELSPARVTEEAYLTWTAHFTPSEGSFTVRLLEDEAPATVANFVGLAEGTTEWTDPKSGQKVKRPYYNGLVFHRVIEGFMIQGGDP